MLFALLSLPDVSIASTYLLCTAVHLPPPLDEVLGDILRGVRAGGEDHRVHVTKVTVLPRFHWTNEVYDLCVSAKPDVRVGGIGTLHYILVLT